jgi:hypothetical protein
MLSTNSFARPFEGAMEAMGGVSAAVVAAIVIATLYFGREVFKRITLKAFCSSIQSCCERNLQEICLDIKRIA